MNLPRYVEVCDVGPRDGLQTIAVDISAADKVQFVERLMASGVQRIEVGSFVHPRVVPQMATTGDVLTALSRHPSVRLRVLVPNMRGAELAIAHDADELLLPLVASETFQHKNVRMTVAEALDGYEAVVARAADDGVSVVGGVGTAFGCPYEGDVPPEHVLSIIERYVSWGVTAVGIADTTGVADPTQVYNLCAQVRDRWPDLQLILHFHNTRGLGLANVYAALQAGVAHFDASAGGLGGCPFAPDASGNIATEDLVHMLDCLGIETNIDLPRLLALGRWLEDELGLATSSAVVRAGPRTHLHPA